MTAPALFDAPAERQRVTSQIGTQVLAFCRWVLKYQGGEFHANDLRGFIGGTAPGSPDRILRALRQAGLVAYVVTDRRKSLYRVLRVAA